MERSQPLAWLLLVLTLFALNSCAPRQTAQPPAAVQEKGGTIAVWDLDDLSPSNSMKPDLGQALSARVMEVMGSKGEHTLVERQRLLLALEELHLGSSELADENTRLKLGKLVGARMMVFGAYLVSGDMVRIDLRLVDVATGKVLKAAERTVSASDLTQWLNAAREAAEEIN